MNSSHLNNIQLAGQVNLVDPSKKLSYRDKAMMVSYVLGKAYLKNLDILIHELKLSELKENRNLAADKQKVRMRMHRDFHEMFKSAGTFLNTKEVTTLEESIENMVSALW